MTTYKCYECKQFKPSEAFSPARLKRKKYHCRACRLAYDKRLRLTSSAQRGRRETVRRIQRKLFSFVTLIKVIAACTDCKNYYPPYVVDFDHRDPSDKVASVSSLVSSASLERLVREIVKCDPVCKNCHAVRTHERGGANKHPKSKWKLGR